MLLKSNWKEKKKRIDKLKYWEYIIKGVILKEYGLVSIICIILIVLSPYFGVNKGYGLIRLSIQSFLTIFSFIILGLINGIFELYVNSVLEDEKINNTINKLRVKYMLVYMLNIMIIPIILKLVTIEKTVQELLIYGLISVFIGIFFSNFSWEDLKEEIYNSE
ncbi:hypothetical protein [Orenia marismortui]|uniref:hypothetical protein n=1 Tax=Orenia marismortui TaxID=46469 RepID=UPI00037F30EE|nr:hypothetical protein [Orenia marismortui]